MPQLTFSTGDMIVYPNPAKDYACIEIKNDGMQSAHDLVILDIQGRLIRSIPSKGTKSIINLDAFKLGLYFIHGRKNPERTVKLLVQ